jgi:hypothetical protein
VQWLGAFLLASIFPNSFFLPRKLLPPINSE